MVQIKYKRVNLFIVTSNISNGLNTLVHLKKSKKYESLNGSKSLIQTNGLNTLSC